MQLRNGTLDVVAFQLLFSDNWRRGNSLSIPTCSRAFYFVSSHPKRIPAYLTLAEPLSWQVWSALGFCLLVLYLFLLAETRAMSSCVSMPPREKDPFLLVSLTAGIMINEAIPDWLLSLHTRKSRQLILPFWIPMACLIGMAYQSNLLSFLVKIRKEEGINTYQDILDKGITMYLQKNTIVNYLLATHPNPTVREAHQVYTKQLVYRVPDIQKFADVKDGRAVFDIAISRHIGSRHLNRRGEHLDIGSFPCGYYFGINNPIFQRSDMLLQNILENGILGKITSRHYWVRALPEREYYRRHGSEENGVTPLALMHILPVYMVAAALILLGAGAAFVEKFSFNRSQMLLKAK